MPPEASPPTHPTPLHRADTRSHWCLHPMPRSPHLFPHPKRLLAVILHSVDPHSVDRRSHPRVRPSASLVRVLAEPKASFARLCPAYTSWRLAGVDDAGDGSGVGSGVPPEVLDAVAAAAAQRPVSYTHLTLPTILLV
eukprot:352531-Chlamydomonas_euryale.AAC.1